jgi:dihydrofolate reductase
MVTAPGRGRIFRTRSELAGSRFLTGSCPCAPGKGVPGNEDGEMGVDDDTAALGFEGIGAYILGRNMFGPVRGAWPEGKNEWKGWWGDEPPYYTPVFLLTHYARAPLEMKGGTTFHFVTEGIQSALEQAKEVAGTQDVRLGGGVSTIRQ